MEKCFAVPKAGRSGFSRQRHFGNPLRSLFLGFSAVLFLGFLPLAAPLSPVLDRLEVDLWPEYDNPGVLVVYRIQLPVGAPLPEPLRFQIPAVAGEPSSVVSEQPDGSLVSLPYTRQVSGDLSIVSFSAPTIQTQLEYYDPSLQIQGTSHQFRYLWPGDYAIQDLTIQVKQPADAIQMQISPDLGTGVMGSDGLVYFSNSLGASPAGHEVTVALSYAKATPALSFERLHPLHPITLPPAPWEPWLGWLGGLRRAMEKGGALGAVGAALVVIAVGSVFFLWGRRRGRTGQRGTVQRGDEHQDSSPMAARFCHQCGYPAGEADLFCRMCGARLRAT